MAYFVVVQVEDGDGAVAERAVKGGAKQGRVDKDNMQNCASLYNCSACPRERKREGGGQQARRARERLICRSAADSLLCREEQQSSWYAQWVSDCLEGGALGQSVFRGRGRFEALTPPNFCALLLVLTPPIDGCTRPLSKPDSAYSQDAKRPEQVITACLLTNMLCNVSECANSALSRATAVECSFLSVI